MKASQARLLAGTFRRSTHSTFSAPGGATKCSDVGVGNTLSKPTDKVYAAGVSLILSAAIADPELKAELIAFAYPDSAAVGPAFDVDIDHGHIDHGPYWKAVADAFLRVSVNAETNQQIRNRMNITQLREDNKESTLTKRVLREAITGKPYVAPVRKPKANGNVVKITLTDKSDEAMNAELDKRQA